MKRIITCFVIMVSVILSAFSQIPQTFSYQAVVRDSENNLVAEKKIVVHVQILQGSDDGRIVYTEKHVVTTNQNGLMTFELGGGETNRNFSSIDWSKAPYFIRTITDVNGKIIEGVTPVLAVPYALYAAKAGNAEVDLSEYAKKSEVAQEVDIKALEANIKALRTKISDTLLFYPKLTDLATALDEKAEKWELTEYYTKSQVNAMLENFLVKFGIDDGSIKGKFSISENKQVYFSKGNLQYRASTNTWRFAENQWDYVGTHKINDVNGGTIDESDNADISETYSGWIDLFGWATSGYGAKPYSTNTSATYYGVRSTIAGTKYDWGLYNVFSNAIGHWRTLTCDEWKYLLNRSSGLLYGIATVNGVLGLVLLPDEWDLTSGGFVPRTKDWTTNVYSLQEWEIMQSLGAVFLPAAGHREGTKVKLSENTGEYWSSQSSDNGTNSLKFTDYFANTSSNSITFGLSVRLVRDID